MKYIIKDKNGQYLKFNLDYEFICYTTKENATRFNTKTAAYDSADPDDIVEEIAE